jgi:thiol-disulfide isomerase/thioredoxin
MRIYIFFGILFLIFSGACRKMDQTTILSGKLSSVKNVIITLIPVDAYFPGLKSNGRFPQTQTDSMGRFKFVFEQKNADFYQIIFDNYHRLAADIFLEPGDSIHIYQSAHNEPPKFLITGKGSEKLKIFQDDYYIFSKIESFHEKIRSSDFPTELAFKRYIDSIYSERINVLDSANNVPEKLRKYHLNALMAEKAHYLLFHLERRNYYMTGEFRYFYPDDSYLEFTDSIIFDNDFSGNIAARLFANVYLTFLARNNLKEKSEEEWWDENLFWKWNYITRQQKSSWNDMLALGTLSEFSFGLMLDDFHTQLFDFKAKMDTLFSDSTNSRLFENNMMPYLNLAPGNVAPDFELPDADGVLHRLSDYRGNIVYIDFWGTWCYPCIQEIPDALLLQEKYKNSSVKFLYVALEYDKSDIENWKNFIAGKDELYGKMLDHKPFPGVHLVAEKQFRNEMIKDYRMNFAPTHVLIDHQGKIVKPRAKRSAAIAEEIDKLLIKINEK